MWTIKVWSDDLVPERATELVARGFNGAFEGVLRLPDDPTSAGVPETQPIQVDLGKRFEIRGGGECQSQNILMRLQKAGWQAEDVRIVGPRRSRCLVYGVHEDGVSRVYAWSNELPGAWKGALEQAVALGKAEPIAGHRMTELRQYGWTVTETLRQLQWFVEAIRVDVDVMRNVRTERKIKASNASLEAAWADLWSQYRGLGGK
jgi:hypothetical protein